MEVFYILPDGNGTRVRGYAHPSYRTIPMRYMVGDAPLDELRQITRNEWYCGDLTAEWRASAEAMVR